MEIERAKSCKQNIISRKRIIVSQSKSNYFAS